MCQAQHRSNLVSGTGFGLPIARRNIAAHGGSLNIDSVENEGTRVTVLLPIEGREETLMVKLHALVIDDNPSVREALEDRVESMGHTFDRSDARTTRSCG